VSHPEVTMPYKWDATRFYHRADTYIGGGKVIGTARGSNGIVHIIDAVVVPAK